MRPAPHPKADGIETLGAWLDERAQGLDDGTVPAAELRPALARAGVIGLGSGLAGDQGDVTEAVAAIATVSERSLAAGFVLWSQRTYLEYLLRSPNEGLRDGLLPEIVSGRLAGATGLSNAMKFLSGLEELQIAGRPDGDETVFEGRMPWVTNLRPEGFHVAGVASGPDGHVVCVSFAGDDTGLSRSSDLDLMAMRSTNTAAIALDGVRLGPDRIIHPDATAWLPEVRPAFLGLQCGLSIGLARRSLHEARTMSGAGRTVLQGPTIDLAARLDREEAALAAGLRSGLFRTQAAPLFRIRIALAEIVAEAVQLELQASGGRAYLTAHGAGFARRYREAAFVPLITPSLVQLKAALQPHAPGAA